MVRSLKSSWTLCWKPATEKVSKGMGRVSVGLLFFHRTYKFIPYYRFNSYLCVSSVYDKIRAPPNIREMQNTSVCRSLEIIMQARSEFWCKCFPSDPGCAACRRSFANRFFEFHPDGYEYYSDNGSGYSSGEEELENLPWSEGGEGGLMSIGLGKHALEVEDGDVMSIFNSPRYSQEELQNMLDNLYGEGYGGKLVGPGAWGKARWRPAECKSEPK